MTFVRTFKRRKKFLDELGVGSSESLAARAADGTLAQFRKWRREDPDFAKDWDDAIEEGTDFIEDVATQRAIRKSDTLMAMILKARRPDKYDRGGKLELSGNVNVEGSKQKLLNRLARLQAAGQLPTGGDQAVPQLSDEANGTEPVPEALPAPSNDAGVSRGGKRRRAAGGA